MPFDLTESGPPAPVTPRAEHVVAFGALNARLGTQDLLAEGKRYDGGAQ